MNDVHALYQRQVRDSSLYPQALEQPTTEWDYYLAHAGKLAQFRKQLSIVKFYPVDSLMNTILSGYINYNVVIFGGVKDIDLKTPNQIVSDLEGVLRKVARNSGGVAVYSKNNLQEMKTIKKHQDFFYKLSFAPILLILHLNYKFKCKNGSFFKYTISFSFLSTYFSLR